MKIDSSKPDVLTGATGAAAPAADSATSNAKTSAPANATDHLSLSSEAVRLAAAAEGGPGVRQDVVDRMRALIDAGSVGNDVSHLADTLIDDLLDDWLPRS